MSFRDEVRPEALAALMLFCVDPTDRALAGWRSEWCDMSETFKARYLSDTRDSHL